MSIYSAAVIVVGLPYEEVFELDNFEDLIDMGKLQSFPYYYDGGGEDDSIVGLVYQETEDSIEVDWNTEKIAKLSKQFKKLTGHDAKTFLTMDIS